MTKRIVWTTDLHLNHVPLNAWEQWIDTVRRHSPDALIVTGDISESDDVVFQLNRIAEAFAIPIYFVLGNHDFYQSSIGKTRRLVIDATRDNPLLHYLVDCGPIELANDVFLVGEDGWGDATRGSYETSPIRLNDFARIKDFYLYDPSRWKSLLQEQGKLSAERLEQKLGALPSSTKHVLVATHLPPFCESCWYQGETTDENWAPFFVCGQVGDVLLRFAASHKDRNYTVLCGHTHHDGIATMAENLIVYTGAAQYGRPDVEAEIGVSQQSLELSLSRPPGSMMDAP
ncbi:MAG: metallophosphoesterase [Pirellulaceae bacterium]|nr:metallophosphoesterase [Pirellulaceae bacterium]